MENIQFMADVERLELMVGDELIVFEPEKQKILVWLNYYMAENTDDDVLL